MICRCQIADHVNGSESTLRSATLAYFRFQRVPCGPSSRITPLGEQILADAIGLGEVAAAAGVLAGLDRGVDLGLRDRRRRVLGAAQRQHAEHAIEVVERAR